MPMPVLRSGRFGSRGCTETWCALGGGQGRNRRSYLVKYLGFPRCRGAPFDVHVAAPLRVSFKPVVRPPELLLRLTGQMRGERKEASQNGRTDSTGRRSQGN